MKKTKKTNTKNTKRQQKPKQKNKNKIGIMRRRINIRLIRTLRNDKIIMRIREQTNKKTTVAAAVAMRDLSRAGKFHRRQGFARQQSYPKCLCIATGGTSP